VRASLLNESARTAVDDLHASLLLHNLSQHEIFFLTVISDFKIFLLLHRLSRLCARARPLHADDNEFLTRGAKSVFYLN
jgi:hypothetical protein